MCTALGNALGVVFVLNSELNCKWTAISDQALTHPLKNHFTHFTPPELI